MARPQARELAEREGLAGIDASLTELIARAGLRSATAVAAAPAAAAADEATVERS